MYSLLADIFDVVVGFAILLLALRFMVQFAAIDRTNPYAKVTYQLTPVVDIFGRIFPTLADGRISTAALVLMFLLRLIFLSGNSQLAGQPVEPFQLFYVGSLTLILDFLDMCQTILTASVVANLIINLLQSDRPIWGFIVQLSEPIIAPFRKLLPQTGMLDMGFMAAYGALYLAILFIRIVGKHLLQL